jgi:hypothetical protein
LTIPWNKVLRELKKKLIWGSIDKKEKTEIVSIAQPTFSLRIKVPHRSVPTWMTVSYGRSSAQVLPWWFKFPTFTSWRDFKDSSYFSEQSQTQVPQVVPGVDISLGSHCLHLLLIRVYTNFSLIPLCCYLRRKNFTSGIFIRTQD